MVKMWFLKFHGWLALIFSLPLAVVLVTGLILSFEPWLVTRAIAPGALDTQKVEALLARHDPDGKARAISYRSYDGALTIGSGRGGILVDSVTGEARPKPSALAALMSSSRHLHETFMIGAGWLVITSTAAMLGVIVLGVLMGWPRFANSVSGWHKAIGWCLLPFLVLSPLTALMMAAGISFSGSSAPPQGAPAAAQAQGAPLTLSEAVAIVGRSQDLSGLVWLRPQGNRLLVRLVDGGEYAVHAVTREGTVAMPRNWPRLWHEGNFAGAWSALMNVIISLALSGLFVTGIWIWLRRQRRKRARRLEKAAAAGK